SFTDDGKKYICQHASIQAYGAHVDGSADAQTITADRMRIEGRFETAGGRTMRGKLVVNTGAAKLTHGAAGTGLVAKDILARGWLDIGAGEKTRESEHEIKDFDDTVETATKNAAALRSLQLDFHAPLTPGTYGAKRIRVSAGAALDFRLGVDNGIVTRIVASITGDVSVFSGNKIHRLALENQKLEADVTGWLGPLVDALVASINFTSPILIRAYDVKFDVASFVAYLAAYYRPYVMDDVNDKLDSNWADEKRIERDTAKADLENRKAKWQADEKHVDADEPKANGAIMKDLLNLQAVSGTLQAAIARPEAVGRKGIDALSGTALIHGSIAGGKLRLDADATVDTGNGTAKVKGLSSGDMPVSDTSTGGTMVTFDSFHVEQFSWDPAAAAKSKPRSH
ncbi:MAG: hypothetical protein HOV81_45430, partial [Kofleriaceae bacterium]|nr:hypothetical protein [Kofleriaceae bacterium]